MKTSNFTHENFVVFCKCQVMRLSCGKSRHKHRLGEQLIQGRPEEKGLGLLEDGKLDLNGQCGLASQKDSQILGCIRSSEASRAREGILSLCSASLWLITYSSSASMLLIEPFKICESNEERKQATMNKEAIKLAIIA
ncbi:hypothetical protein DUI87_10344 [Hirundo rustica rustica]|uniref:Uncharacterized protein n=1 Tax=Hirundo rustica rustica TaxID=333673 RepID=A0A3M0KHU9_HIRRU|nr:hypothetical protein DUI87_10344 [Hirundo rustica rustica]